MGYNAQKHSVFSQRCRNIARNFQAMREELAALDAIYTNETASGSDVAFVDTAYATKQEHIDIILLARDVESFFGNAAVATADRQQWLTPFLANGGE